MALDNFRTQKIIWDRANKKIFEAIEASSGDSNGRKLVVQIINQEVTESLSGKTLSLGWKSRNGAKGLDAFNAVDASKGIFEIYYTTEMLSNIGNLEASLILIDSTSRIESSTFTISVRPSTVDDESVESENSFTALTEALVKVNDFTTQLSQKANKSEANSLQSQINHLVVDSGESNAEVAQARVDSKGNIFPTVKGHLDNIENAMRQRLSEISSVWEQGTISVNGDASSDTRIRTNHFFRTEQFSSPFMVELMEGYQYNIVFFNENKDRVGESGWKQDSQINSIDYPFFRVVLSKVDNSNITVEEASNVKIYEEVEIILDEEITSEKIANNAITPNKTTFIHGDGQYNIFNGSYTKLYIVNETVHAGDDFATEGKGFIIKIKGGSNYYIRKGESNRFLVGFHKSSIDLSTARDTASAITLDYPTITPSEGVPLNAPIDANYLVVYVSNDGVEPDLQVTEGKDYPFFLGYGLQINFSEKSIKTNSLVDGEVLMGLVELDKKEFETYHFLGDINTIYKSSDTLHNVDLGNYAKLINAYDTLVNTFPNYITKNSIGADAFGNTMYEYVFRAPSIGNRSNYLPRRKKLLITTGVHGWEHQTTLAVYRFFHELCYNPRNIDELEFIKWNIDFKVVPSVTPSCYTTERVNANGVNINRNFPTGWRATGENPGSSPASELETQNIMSWFEDNLDAYYYVDYHAQAAEKLTYYIENDTSATIAQSVVRVYEKRWRELNGITETYTLTGDVAKATGGMTIAHSEHLGISGMIPDCPWIGYIYRPVVEQRIVLEIFANTIYALVKKH